MLLSLYLCKSVLSKLCVDMRCLYIALCVCFSAGVRAVTSSLTDIGEWQPVTSPAIWTLTFTLCTPVTKPLLTDFVVFVVKANVLCLILNGSDLHLPQGGVILHYALGCESFPLLSRWWHTYLVKQATILTLNTIKGSTIYVYFKIFKHLKKQYCFFCLYTVMASVLTCYRSTAEMNNCSEINPAFEFYFIFLFILFNEDSIHPFIYLYRTFWHL